METTGRALAAVTAVARVARANATHESPLVVATAGIVHSILWVGGSGGISVIEYHRLIGYFITSGLFVDEEKKEEDGIGDDLYNNSNNI